jgi:hypothetical protein
MKVVAPHSRGSTFCSRLTRLRARAEAVEIRVPAPDPGGSVAVASPARGSARRRPR